MKPRGYFVLFALCCAVIMSGCHKPEKKLPANAAISPGEPNSWDVGSYLLKYRLPSDVEDGFKEFAKTNETTFGIMAAHKEISSRYHELHDLTLYGHNGTARFHVGGKDFFIGVGDVLYIPRGAVYSAESTGTGELEYFAVFSPRFDGDDVVHIQPAR